MSDVYKFPNGYDVTVCKKQDILDCIDANIVDKEVALAIVEQCEKDVVRYIKDGKWAGIPFIGNIKIPEIKKLEEDEEQKALILDAKVNLNREEYILFRTRLGKDNAKKVKYDRYFRYVTSRVVTDNYKVYKKYLKKKSETYVLFYFFSIYNIKRVNEDNIIVYE